VKLCLQTTRLNLPHYEPPARSLAICITFSVSVDQTPPMHSASRVPIILLSIHTRQMNSHHRFLCQFVNPSLLRFFTPGLYPPASETLIIQFYEDLDSNFLFIFFTSALFKLITYLLTYLQIGFHFSFFSIKIGLLLT